MELKRIEDMKGGWFVGDFSPSAFRTKSFEAGYKLHPKGEVWDAHYHREITEVNFLLRGRMLIQGKELRDGDIFTLYPNEIADPVFLEDCEVFVIKMPSIVGDKYLLKDEVK